MIQLKRWHLFATFIALMALRMVIGFHFFSEGAEKVRDGNFDSGPFLRSAKGPFASYFHNMLEDSNGHIRLCVKTTAIGGQPIQPEVNGELTEVIWDDFVKQATRHYQFGDQITLDVLQEQQSKVAGQEKRSITNEIRAIQQQEKNAGAILERHKDELKTFLDLNRDKILHFVNTEDRLDGFQRDGENRNRISKGVDSLNGQVDSIRSDRYKTAVPWYNEIETLWDSLELQINDLAVNQQKDRGTIALDRPFAQENSMQSIINRIIPWFDVIVGGLLLIGLFTRFASLAGIVFLISVVLSQPFWVSGTVDTWMQIIEIFALLVVFATCAGRYGGMDYFLTRFFGKGPSADSIAARS